VSNGMKVPQTLKVNILAFAWGAGEVLDSNQVHPKRQ
jgi:hypothetical protein